MLNKKISDELTTVAGIASAIARHALTYGIDIVPICKALEIDPLSFQSLTSRISLDRLCRLLEALALLSDDEAFGIKCASLFVAGSTGPFGYGLISAPTVRDFAVFLDAHIQYATNASYFRLTEDQKGAKLEWTFAPIIVRRNQFVDMTAALALQRLRDIIGAKCDQVGLELERPKPRHPQTFRDILTKRITFDGNINAIRIPSEILDLSNPRGDRKLFELMDIQCRAMRPAPTPEGHTFVDQVRKYLDVRIGEPHLSLEDIAPYFGISERTFQRRLAELGTNLNDLRDDVRRELSLGLLTESDLPISDISYRLGYSAPSAFTRSVTRWFGTTPKGLRERKAG